MSVEYSVHTAPRYAYKNINEVPYIISVTPKQEDPRTQNSTPRGSGKMAYRKI